MSQISALAAPRYWGYHLVVIAALVAAGWLGLWQLHGYQERREAEARDLTQVAPVALTDVIGPDDAFPGQYVGQPVSVQGTWVPDATVYVSGRAHDGEEGYWVVDPLLVGESVLPTVRGWAAQTADVPPVLGLPSWWAGCSRRKVRERPTTTRTTTCCRSYGWPTWHSGSTRTCTAPTWSPETPAGSRPGAGRPRAAAGRGPADRAAQPPLCDRVVVLRSVRGVRVVAMGQGGEPAAAQTGRSSG